MRGPTLVGSEKLSVIGFPFYSIFFLLFPPSFFFFLFTFKLTEYSTAPDVDLSAYVWVERTSVNHANLLTFCVSKWR